MLTYPIRAKPGLIITRTITFYFLHLYVCIKPAFDQHIRYIHPVFESLQVTLTFYGTKVSLPGRPNDIKVPLPVSQYKAKGDTAKNLPLIIYLILELYCLIPLTVTLMVGCLLLATLIIDLMLLYNYIINHKTYYEMFILSDNPV